MPSIRSVTNALLVLSHTVLGLRISRPRLDGISLAASASCPNAQLSCHNSSAVKNLCCFNSPGGTLLQTQFWDTDPASGPSDSWTIHGLWPDNCDGTYEANCDTSREYGNVSAIIKASGNDELLDYMTKYWTSNMDSAESFWEHEWDKHGTCISTLKPDCYTEYKPTEEVPDFFQATVDLFKTLPTYSWLKAAGISPSTSKTYSSSDIQDVLSSKHGADVYLGCTDEGALEEVWYFFNVKGSVQTGEYVATGPVGASSSCPDDGIKYLPKSSVGGGGDGGSSNSTTASSAPTASATTASSSAAPTPTGPVFSGKGNLNVIPDGSSTKQGCLISAGKWYTSGTCATFGVEPSSDSSGFTLSSSKGECGVSDGQLACGADVSDASTFTADGDRLVLRGGSTFYADTVPSGSQQGTVYVSEKGHAVSFSIEWQSV